MQSTLTSDGNNGHDPNKIIVSEQDLTVDRHNLKERNPELTATKVPGLPATPDVAPGGGEDRQPTPKQKKTPKLNKEKKEKTEPESKKDKKDDRKDDQR